MFGPARTARTQNCDPLVALDNQLAALLSIQLSSTPPRIPHGQNQGGASSYRPHIFCLRAQIGLFYQKLASLRAEADNAVERAETAEAKNKQYEQELLRKDQEIISLQTKLSVLDAELEKTEAKLADAKHAQEESEQNRTANENLTRKIQLLEEELDSAEKNVKETVDKYVLSIAP